MSETCFILAPRADNIFQLHKRFLSVVYRKSLHVLETLTNLRSVFGWSRYIGYIGLKGMCPSDRIRIRRHQGSTGKLHRLQRKPNMCLMRPPAFKPLRECTVPKEAVSVLGSGFILRTAVVNKVRSFLSFACPLLTIVTPRFLVDRHEWA